MTAHDHCENAAKKVKKTLVEEGRKLVRIKKGKAKRPCSEKCRPELNLTKKLNDDLANRFQQCIDALQ